ncbi:MAG TPA: hypothetical protein VMC08_01835 [Bacteroidales bacterium]|nr:hypothetical protein [Bacteroidales bacterium]
MKKLASLFALLFMGAGSLNAQIFLQEALHTYEAVLSGMPSFPTGSGPDSLSDRPGRIPSGISGILSLIKNHPANFLHKKSFGYDTLVVGVPPNDSLIITGNWVHQGPVLVLGSGILRFKNARATVVGDLWVVGDHALVTADSSYLYFPQQYFYQRSMIVAGHGGVIYRNTTMDHSGLSHNFAVFDSASVHLSNVTDVGFTTWGTAKKARVEIDHINTAGEFVITDSVSLHFDHVNTLLLWHQVPSGSSLDLSFPDGDTLSLYTLDPDTPGVSGLGYTIRVDSSTNVMWALMPVDGSDIEVTGSKIRSIGLWFTGSDSLTVSGLVDNSSYDDFTAPLNDRNLHLVNSSVQTWSLYPMNASRLAVTGCILGEIGTEGKAQLTAQDIFVDGSGGYWWAVDTTFLFAVRSTAVNDLRTDRSGIFIFAYSTMISGIASAHGNSILMLIQSQLPEDPQLWDGACIWEANIGKPSSAFVDTLVPVFGSAWIDKTPASTLMDFAWYRVYWQKQGDSGWTPAGNKVFVKKYDEILANWDTHGLSPGSYILRLLMTDNTADSNQVEAIKGINLLPKILGTEDHPETALRAVVYPDPVTGNSVLSFRSEENAAGILLITDIYGRSVREMPLNISRGENNIPLRAADFSSGKYYFRIRSTAGSPEGSFIVNK